MIFVILAHTSPEILQKSLLKLQNENNYFVIHVDIKSNINPFFEITRGISNCHFTTERYNIEWGTFSIIEATLHAFDFVRKMIRKKQRIILLSGTDYPIKPLKCIFKFFKNEKDTIFMDYERIPKRDWYEGGINRFPLYNTIKNKISLFGGSQWFSIPPLALTIIFDFLKTNSDFFEYYRHVHIPDESFFQTLFLNCDHPYILKNLKNKNLHYIKWTYPNSHPETLTIEDYDDITMSNCLFARKFDVYYSKNLIRRLELN